MSNRPLPHDREQIRAVDPDGRIVCWLAVVGYPERLRDGRLAIGVQELDTPSDTRVRELREDSDGWYVWLYDSQSSRIEDGP